MNESERKSIRVDLQLIADMIKPGSRVLDIGCGNGALLDYLVHFKQVDGRGIEIGAEGVNACISAGLSVIQGDAEADIGNYPDQAFDYVILSQTLQAMHRPDQMVEQLLRIGKQAVVSFPNFANWRHRLILLLRGRMPVNESLPFQWYETPNIHLCTIQDFVVLCRNLGVGIEHSLSIGRNGKPRRIAGQPFLANLLGEQAVFLLKK